MNNKIVLVANASRARAFVNTGVGHGLRLVQEFSHNESRMLNQDLASDRGGQFHLSGSNAGFFASKHTPKENESRTFAAELAQFLTGQAGQGADLIVVASPSFMGYLKEHLHANVVRKILATVDKDYTQHSEKQLVDGLSGVVAL